VLDNIRNESENIRSKMNYDDESYEGPRLTKEQINDLNQKEMDDMDAAIEAEKGTIINPPQQLSKLESKIINDSPSCTTTAKPILTILAEQPAEPRPIRKEPAKINLANDLPTIKYADGINPVSLPVIKQARAEGMIIETQKPRIRSTESIEIIEGAEIIVRPVVTTQPMQPRTKLKPRITMESIDRLIAIRDRGDRDSRITAERTIGKHLQKLITTGMLTIDQKKQYVAKLNESNSYMSSYNLGEDPLATIALKNDLEFFLKDNHTSYQGLALKNVPLDPNIVYVQMYRTNQICTFDVRDAWDQCERTFSFPGSPFRKHDLYQIVSSLGPQKIGIIFDRYPAEDYESDLMLLKESILGYVSEYMPKMKISDDDMIVAKTRETAILIITSHYVKDRESRNMFIYNLCEYLKRDEDKFGGVSHRLDRTAKKHRTILNADLVPLMIDRNMSVEDVNKLKSKVQPNEMVQMPSISCIKDAKELGIAITNNNMYNQTLNQTLNQTVNVQGNANTVNTTSAFGDITHQSHQVDLSAKEKEGIISFQEEFFISLDRLKPSWYKPGNTVSFKTLYTHYTSIGGLAPSSTFAKMLKNSGKYEYHAQKKVGNSNSSAYTIL
jgi:hypothetical protein